MYSTSLRKFSGSYLLTVSRLHWRMWRIFGVIRLPSLDNLEYQQLTRTQRAWRGISLACIAWFNAWFRESLSADVAYQRDVNITNVGNAHNDRFNWFSILYCCEIDPYTDVWWKNINKVLCSACMIVENLNVCSSCIVRVFSVIKQDSLYREEDSKCLPDLIIQSKFSNRVYINLVHMSEGLQGVTNSHISQDPHCQPRAYSTGNLWARYVTSN